MIDILISLLARRKVVRTIRAVESIEELVQAVAEFNNPELVRTAAAWGWEICRQGTGVVKELMASEDNPFTKADWFENVAITE